MMKRLLSLSIVLLSLSGLIAGWFSVQFVKEGWKYLRLNTPIQAQIINWEIKMISFSHFALLATYQYWVNGKEFIGNTLFSSPIYLNYYAAENELKLRQEQVIKGWYDHRRPGFSSLQKKFPKKELTHAALTCGVFIYFCISRNFLLTRILDKSLYEKYRDFG